MSVGQINLAVVGAGYVGLVNAACFAHLGHSVTVIDHDQDRIRHLGKGTIPIHEPNLSELVTEGVAAGRLTFTNELEHSISRSDIVLIAVGTPPDEIDGSIDLQQMFRAVSDIAPFCTNQTIVVKSTVPPGTSQRVEKLLLAGNAHVSTNVVSCPEFLREGAAVQDFLNPDRIVIGIVSPSQRAVMERLFHSFIAKGVEVLFTSRNTSELIKYAANSFLALKVAFINEMADICEAVGADIRDLATGIGKDPRIGPAFLKPGPGFGGSCFPKDTLAFARVAEDFGVPSKLIEAVISANDHRIRSMARRIVAACERDVNGKRIALFGLTFKANTDDIRASPALAIASRLASRGAAVVGYDPKGAKNALNSLPRLEIASSPTEAARGADAIVVATDWDEFSNLDLEKLESEMRNPLIIDLRNVVDIKEATLAGFRVVSLGYGAGLLDTANPNWRSEIFRNEFLKASATASAQIQISQTPLSMMTEDFRRGDREKKEVM